MNERKWHEWNSTSLNENVGGEIVEMELRWCHLLFLLSFFFSHNEGIAFSPPFALFLPLLQSHLSFSRRKTRISFIKLQTLKKGKKKEAEHSWGLIPALPSTWLHGFQSQPILEFCVFIFWPISREVTVSPPSAPRSHHSWLLSLCQRLPTVFFFHTSETQLNECAWNWRYFLMRTMKLWRDVWWLNI